MSNTKNRLKIEDFKAKIDILVKARLRIKSGSDNFVCFAVHKAADDMRLGLDRARELREYIMRQIKPYSNLDDWVRHKRSKFNRDKNSMCDHRVQWIEWMIQQYRDQIKELTENVG